MQVLQFKYNGGSHPGSVRTVFFKGDYWSGANQSYITAYDFDADQFRRFNKVDIYAVAELKATIVDVGQLPKNVNVQSLLDGYIKDGRYAYYDSTLHSVVATEKAKASPDYRWNSNKTKVTITGPNGSFTLRCYGANYTEAAIENRKNANGQAVEPSNLRYGYLSKNPVDLLTELTRVLG